MQFCSCCSLVSLFLCLRICCLDILRFSSLGLSSAGPPPPPGSSAPSTKTSL
uniref:Uncharacterized protein n=1 Tax=Anguilla anguilla TaxID=7936 RepID=A0A0E9W3P0_ANGAN